EQALGAPRASQQNPKKFDAYGVGVKPRGHDARFFHCRRLRDPVGAGGYRTPCASPGPLRRLPPDNHCG
ncbi:MAG: hypothetical protein SF339_29715, partial [Blastocatellia bacterium]|nr:hypothetical protein [Blastocatellia bacterium]